MMSNSMFKKTAIAALLTSAPFASTDSTVSALRLRAQVTPGVHRNPTQHIPTAVVTGNSAAFESPVQQDQLADALSGVAPPVGNAMNPGDGQVAVQQQKRVRKEGCCHNTCNALDDCCMHDACFNLWLFSHLRRQGAFRNPAPAAPRGEQMSRDEDGCTGCGTVQCPSNAGDCNGVEVTVLPPPPLPVSVDSEKRAEEEKKKRAEEQLRKLSGTVVPQWRIDADKNFVGMKEVEKQQQAFRQSTATTRGTRTGSKAAQRERNQGAGHFTGLQ